MICVNCGDPVAGHGRNGCMVHTEHRQCPCELSYQEALVLTRAALVEKPRENGRAGAVA